MFLKFVILSLSIGFSANLAHKQSAGFSLFFQPLYELPAKTSQDYIKEFRATLKKYPSKNIDLILTRNYQNDFCAKKKMKTCVHGLYRVNACVRKRGDKISVLCAKQSWKQNTSNYFQESVFNRLNWNHFALQLSRTCQKMQNKTCKELNKIHRKYFSIYRKFIKEKRKKARSKKSWDL